MADRTIHVLEPATSIDLITLEEAKILLGIPSGDTTQDAQLALLISLNSATIAEICNRTFAREKVEEHWREVGNGRLFLSHWPVKQLTDIESVLMDDVALTVGQYDLEEASGKLSNYTRGGWGNHAVVTYTGGYNLPEEAPLPLKQAAAVLIQGQRTQQQQAAVAGIRQISHKEARIAYFDSGFSSTTGSKKGGGSGTTISAVEDLLKQYMRFEI